MEDGKKNKEGQELALNDWNSELPNWNDGIARELDSFPSCADKGVRTHDAQHIVLDGVVNAYRAGQRKEELAGGGVVAVAPAATTSQQSVGNREGCEKEGRKSLTPIRSGIKGQALRIRLEEGDGGKSLTPASCDDERGSGTDIVKMDRPRMAFTGILKKKLEFTVGDGKSGGGSSVEEGNQVLLSQDGSVAQQHQTSSMITPAVPVTATRKLQFETTGAYGKKLMTPVHDGIVVGSLPTTVGTTRRRVTFGGGVEARERGAHQGDSDRHDTVMSREPVIDESCDYMSDEDVKSINSKNAGSTPFDRRLSALFRKYSPAAEDDATSDIAIDVVDMIYKESVSPVFQRPTKDEEDEGRFVTRKELAAALRRSLQCIQESKKRKETSYEREPLCGVMTPTTGLLSTGSGGSHVSATKGGPEACSTPSGETSSRKKEREDTEFSFGSVTPMSEISFASRKHSADSTPDFCMDTARTGPSCSPSLISLYGKAQRIPTPPVDLQVKNMNEELENMHIREEESTKEIHLSHVRRSPRIAAKQAAHTPNETDGPPKGEERRYNTRSASKAKSKQTIQGTPKTLKLSPTEQSIRESLKQRRRNTLSPQN